MGLVLAVKVWLHHSTTDLLTVDYGNVNFYSPVMD